MNASLRAQHAYRHHAQAAKTGRETEYDAFARVTSRIKSAATKGRAGYNDLVDALHENRKLWTILAGDVVSKSNALPSDMRARIFYLSEFTQKHSSLVLRKKASVKPLLEINIAIMRGLKQTRQAQDASVKKTRHSSVNIAQEHAANVSEAPIR